MVPQNPLASKYNNNNINTRVNKWLDQEISKSIFVNKYNSNFYFISNSISWEIVWVEDK